MTKNPTHLFDMHVHTVRSDGLFSVLQLAQMARRSGLAGLVFTDHDALPDSDSLHKAEQISGVRLLAGVELSTHWQGRGFHLLGYGFDNANSDLRALCRELQEQRRHRAQHMIANLHSRGISLRVDSQTAWMHCQSIGRLHLARELVRQRHANGIRAAFHHHLSSCDHTMENVSLSEAVDVLHSAGGVAVLAHPPAGMTQEMWKSLIDAGVDGLETGHPTHSTCHRKFLANRVQEYGLLATAGSDYHGDDIRRYLGSHTVDSDQLSAIWEHRAACVE